MPFEASSVSAAPTLLFAALLLASQAVVAGVTDVAIYADDAYPPYSHAVNGEARGAYAAILRKAFARMPGYRVEIRPVPWKRGLKMLEAGEAFALYPPYHRPAERPYMDYSVPILAESVAVFCHEALLPKRGAGRWPQDYLGLRIGVNTGFLIGGSEFEQARKDGRIIVDEARGTDENLKKLLLGRLDCYMNDRLAILDALLRIKGEDGRRYAAQVAEGATISQEFGYLGVTRTDNGRFPFKHDFMRQLDTILGEMKRSGEIEHIVELELRR